MTRWAALVGLTAALQARASVIGVRTLSSASSETAAPAKEVERSSHACKSE